MTKNPECGATHPDGYTCTYSQGHKAENHCEDRWVTVRDATILRTAAVWNDDGAIVKWLRPASTIA